MYPRIVPLPNVTITELGITELLYYGLLLLNTPHSEPSLSFPLLYLIQVFDDESVQNWIGRICNEKIDGTR